MIRPVAPSAGIFIPTKAGYGAYGTTVCVMLASPPFSNTLVVNIALSMPGACNCSSGEKETEASPELLMLPSKIVWLSK